jgi:hypothetical protein|tara:strand:- start:1400 stop:1645 length:246 start_codon:yes stop_codon:yes gene_type:complete
MDLKTTSVDSGAVDVNAVISNPSAVSKLTIDVAIIQKPQAIHDVFFHFSGCRYYRGKMPNQLGASVDPATSFASSLHSPSP